jgi:F-type H+-transporting ATPase subunit gamma
MKSISAAKLRKALVTLNHLTRYMKELQSIIRILLPKVNTAEIELFTERKEGPDMLLVISADKGLCGSFNDEILAKLEEELKRNTETELVVVGKKAIRYLSRKEIPIGNSFPGLISQLTYEDSHRLSLQLQKRYMEKSCRSLKVIHAPYTAVYTHSVALTTLLPLSFPESTEDGDTTGHFPEYIIEPDPRHFFSSLISEYFPSLVYRLLLESWASISRVRMVAMDKATQNASELVRNLTLTMNKLRQESITSELLEIISTTEAMK